MAYRRESPFEFSVEELDRELLIRGAQLHEDELFKFTSGQSISDGRNDTMKGTKELYRSYKSLTPNKALSHISTEELSKILVHKIRERNIKR